MKMMREIKCCANWKNWLTVVHGLRGFYDVFGKVTGNLGQYKKSVSSSLSTYFKSPMSALVKNRIDPRKNLRPQTA